MRHAKLARIQHAPALWPFAPALPIWHNPTDSQMRLA